jgi:hypothetical protein
MGFLPSLKIGEFLSQSVFQAKLFVRKISIGSSIQAQGTGEFMRRKWRIIESNYSCGAGGMKDCKPGIIVHDQGILFQRFGTV